MTTVGSQLCLRVSAGLWRLCVSRAACCLLQSIHLRVGVGSTTFSVCLVCVPMSRCR